MHEMREITGIRQDVSGLRKRWFTSVTEDLYVWTEGQSLHSFEYCFDKDESERAIRWHCDFAPSFTFIDSGDHPGGYKRSPMLIAGNKPDMPEVVSRFKCSTRLVEKELMQAILQRLRVL